MINIEGYEVVQELLSKGVKLPPTASYEKLINDVLALYKNFENDNKRYESREYGQECGRNYYNIYEVKIKKDYEDLGEWAEELTGKVGGSFIPQKYGDVIDQIVYDFVYEELPKVNGCSNYEELEEKFDTDIDVKMYIESELLGLKIKS